MGELNGMGGMCALDELGSLLFVCEKISNIIFIKIKSIYVNVNSVILTYVISNQKGGDSDG